ncbi:ABC transporter substrate-binding protein [Syntrophomonas wolfei]|uniref:Branched-chain amino acid ABC transporter, periplasmic amino acid-binding protein, putative n=1 Tax=Syntrophomonas wolfei subsp. wolfei (strain DSM 2245B / Goettingen) TaxID=335541 RepID=Q0AV49_SYNWW|nr:ABC transporter substrate-binding protein [Syntrophomonas wolfei]ABI69405.1 branched-chain amino acid ABC transporter, periplasmic amino acid-binding protein, putative [Syntrophomonas wolfei subsp. wolfei str. Goettingen G311]
MIRGRKSRWAILLCLLLAVAMLAGCSSNKEAAEGNKDADKSQEEVIKLGFLGATTGDVANYGIPGKKGMEMAIDDLNAQGGILGKKVEGVYEDNKGENSEIALIATKYITRDKVVAMVGDPCTGLTKVAADIAQKNKVVIFSAGATGTGVVEIGDYVFRNTLLDQFAVPSVVDWMMNSKGWKKFAIITSLNNGYSTALTPVFQEAIKAKGGKIVNEDTINDGETDFTAQITKLKNTGADVLVFTGYYREAALLQNEAKKQGLDITLLGGDGLYGHDLIKLGKDAVEEKVIYYCGFSSDQPSPETDAFIKKYVEKYKEQPDMFSAQYYDAIMILAKAMTDAKSTDPSVFKDELAKLKDYPGVSGNTTFRADREPIKSPICLITVKDGEFFLLEKIPVKVQ